MFNMSQKQPYILHTAHAANTSRRISELKSRLLPTKLTILRELSLSDRKQFYHLSELKCGQTDLAGQF